MKNWTLDSGIMLYLVMRSTGEYSDRSEVALLAYDNEAAANYHVQRAEERRRELGAVDNATSNGFSWPRGCMGVWDPEHDTGNYALNYYVIQVPKACLMMDELLKIEGGG